MAGAPQSIDQSLDTAIAWIFEKLEILKNSFMIWSLITLNAVSKGWDAGYAFTMKSVQGIMDAHSKKVWVFTERNSVPWPLLENDYKESDKYPLVYFPETYKLSGGTDSGLFSFNDVVTAELKGRGGSTFDLTTTFYNLRWTAEYNPSLYEVAILHCLENKLLFIISDLQKYTLEVMTADAKTLVVSFDSLFTLVPFTSWEDLDSALHPVLPASAPASASASASVSPTVDTDAEQPFAY